MTLRPQETPPGFGDYTDDPILALSRLDLFRSLSTQEREQLGAISEVQFLDQDRVIPRTAQGSKNSAYCFLAKGQIAFAEFVPGTIPKPPKNKKKRVTPTMQVAKRNITLFEVGDFFTDDHVSKMRDQDGERVEAALFTCVPCVLVKIPKKDLDEILKAAPHLADAIAMRAEESYYRQSFLKLDDRSDIFVFRRHRLPVATYLWTHLYEPREIVHREGCLRDPPDGVITKLVVTIIFPVQLFVIP